MVAFVEILRFKTLTEAHGGPWGRQKCLVGLSIELVCDTKQSSVQVVIPDKAGVCCMCVPHHLKVVVAESVHVLGVREVLVVKLIVPKLVRGTVVDVRAVAVGNGTIVVRCVLEASQTIPDSEIKT